MKHTRPQMDLSYKISELKMRKTGCENNDEYIFSKLNLD
jgi:hypothetical protein